MLPDGSEPSSRPTTAAHGPLLVLASTLLALVAWLPSLRLRDWAYDDLEVLEGNPVVQGDLGPLAAFERDYWAHLGAAGHYRPLAALSLRADLALHGMEPSAFHRTNAFLHAAVVLLCGLCFVLLGVHAPTRPFPWIGLSLFAVHPALADSVAWISGRTSMLSALGGLLGALAILIATVPWRDDSLARAARVGAGSAIGMLLALLCKEDGVIFAALFLGLGWLHSRRAAVGSACGVAVGVGVYLALRAHVYGSPWPLAPHAPLEAASLWERSLVGGRALLEAARLTVLPLDYPLIYERWSSFRDVEPWIAGLGWGTWAVCAVLGLRALRASSSRIAGGSALLACASFLPLVQLIPAGVLFAPRFLYLPLLFGAFAFDSCLRRGLGGYVRSVAPVLIALGVAGAWQRTSVYASKTSFYEEQLRHVPDDAPAYNELALASEARGEVDAARRHWQRAIELDPTYGRPWSNLGRLALAEGDLERAERCLRRAAELGRGNAIAHANLGALLLKRERPLEALASFERATRLAPGMGGAWRGAAKANLALERYAEAAESLRRARSAGVQEDADLHSLQLRVEAGASAGH
jgi:tetratricopeptide (TPR) repeat protein